MINVIFSFLPTVPFTEEQTQAFTNEAVWVAVPEMKDGTFQAYVDSITDMEKIHTMLGTLGTVKLIGVWNIDGTQYGFERKIDENGVVTTVQIETPLTYPLNRIAYLNALRDNGDGTRPIDMLPVNKFAGMVDRDL